MSQIDPTIQKPNLSMSPAHSNERTKTKAEQAINDLFQTSLNNLKSTNTPLANKP